MFRTIVIGVLKEKPKIKNFKKGKCCNFTITAYSYVARKKIKNTVRCTSLNLEINQLLEGLDKGQKVLIEGNSTNIFYPTDGYKFNITVDMVEIL